MFGARVTIILMRGTLQSIVTPLISTFSQMAFKDFRTKCSLGIMDVTDLSTEAVKHGKHFWMIRHLNSYET